MILIIIHDLKVRQFLFTPMCPYSQSVTRLYDSYMPEERCYRAEEPGYMAKEHCYMAELHFVCLLMHPLRLDQMFSLNFAYDKQGHFFWSYYSPLGLLGQHFPLTMVPSTAQSPAPAGLSLALFSQFTR